MKWLIKDVLLFEYDNNEFKNKYTIFYHMEGFTPYIKSSCVSLQVIKTHPELHM